MWLGFFLAVAVTVLACHLWNRLKVADAVATQLRRELDTTRQRRQRELADVELRQQALFNAMVEGVLLLDAKGNIRLANQSIERIFGITIDLRGKNILEAFRLHELQALVNVVLVEGQVLDHELELPSLDGRCLQVNATTLLNREGLLHGIILVFHDLTRLRQLERTRHEFVANVSHELRTPLSMIKGYAETLIDGAKDNPKVAVQFLHTIEKHADRLTYLIEDLLTISRLESGKVALNVQETELRPLIDRAFDELRGRAGNKTIELLNEVSEELRVRVDPERIHQVLLNLVDNAIKYGRSSVRVIIGASAVSGEFAHLWVNDNGPGIAAEHLDRIFERFYRVDEARSRDQGGTGLGLAIVKHIVQSHGGKVWAASEPEKGATFHLTLPSTRTLPVATSLQSIVSVAMPSFVMLSWEIMSRTLTTF